MVVSPESTLKKPDFYQSKKILMTSPILHIGSSVSRLNPFEYVQTDKKVYLPNQEALAKGLLAKGKRFFNDYIQAIEERKDITKLLEQAFGSEWWEAKDTQGCPIFPKEAISQKLTSEKITDLRPMIRNGMGQLFIPGSSIKGAIRTAVAYYLLKHADRFQLPASERVSEIEKKLREKLGKLDQHEQKFLDDQLFMDSLFSKFHLKYQERNFPGQGPNTDFFRAIKITDSAPLLEKKIKTKKGKEKTVNIPVVAEVVVSSIFRDYAKYKASIYTEMVGNVQTEFTITLDTEMLSWFTHKQGMKLPFSNLDELLQICQEFTQEQWDYEHDYWQEITNNRQASGKNLDFDYIREFYEPEKCPYSLRLGWGSGMNGTTIGLCLDDELREDIRDTCGLKAPGFEAPKSRRTVMNKGEIKFVPGWVKFKAL